MYVYLHYAEYLTYTILFKLTTAVGVGITAIFILRWGNRLRNVE